jgi:cobalt-zinc-cadmium efflux system membrane fusion protein
VTTTSGANPPEQHDAHRVPARATPWPVAAQGTALAIFAAILVAALFVLPAIAGLAAAPDEVTSDAPHGFSPTPQQWAGLNIAPVTALSYAPQIHAEGRIALDDDLSTPVFSPVSGRVTRVMARAGDVVQAGAPLFAVQSSELAQAESDMISALAALHTAQAQLTLTTANEQRQHLLYLGHGAAQRDWQQSQVDLATARGGLNSADIAVAAVRSRLAILGLDQAAIARIQAARTQDHENADAIMRAPIAGTITQRQISPGQNIVGALSSQGSAAAVFTIGNLQTLWMLASAREEDAGRLHVGDIALVTVPAYPGRIFKGIVSYVAPVIDPTTHRLMVRADIANPDGALKPDMLANFDIVTAAPGPVLMIPQKSVIYEGADAHVWLADPAHKTLALRPVTLGAVDKSMIEVTKGLTAHDSIVTSGAVFIDRALSGD